VQLLECNFLVIGFVHVSVFVLVIVQILHRSRLRTSQLGVYGSGHDWRFVDFVVFELLLHVVFSLDRFEEARLLSCLLWLVTVVGLLVNLLLF